MTTLQRQSDLAALKTRLNAAASVPELLAKACAEALAWCGADRAVILSVNDGVLSATGVGAIAHPPSDALRRRMLAEPVQLEHGSIESELIRRAEGLRQARGAGSSVLAGHLGLRHPLCVPIVPEARAVALLVLDRATPAGGAAAALFAHLVGVALERLVLRLRISELGAELRHLTASANSLAHEAASAPVTLSSDFGYGQVFALPPVVQVTPDGLDALLTARELDVIALMAQGLSNREIGTELHLSSDTVKAHVARLLRKLGAHNRAEAVARYLTMGQRHVSGH